MADSLVAITSQYPIVEPSPTSDSSDRHVSAQRQAGEASTLPGKAQGVAEEHRLWGRHVGGGRWTEDGEIV